MCCVRKILRAAARNANSGSWELLTELGGPELNPVLPYLSGCRTFPLCFASCLAGCQTDPTWEGGRIPEPDLFGKTINVNRASQRNLMSVLGGILLQIRILLGVLIWPACGRDLIPWPGCSAASKRVIRADVNRLCCSQSMLRPTLSPLLLPPCAFLAVWMIAKVLIRLL